MSLTHGREITAGQVESIVGREFSAQRFASLCNAASWALAHPPAVAQAAFTERVFVRDNGVDAEWMVDLPAFEVPPASLIGVGRSVLQYKLRDALARDRNRIVADLLRELRGAAGEVRQRTGRPLDAYVLYTNVDLTIDQKRELEAAIREEHHELRVQAIGAAVLAAILNNLPHLRSAYFSTDQFATWTHAWESHNNISLSTEVPRLVGRDSLVEAAKTAIDDESIRVVVLAGAPNIGKTRLALSSTQHRPIDTVFAMDGRSITVTDLLSTMSPAQRNVIVVDDPDEERARELIAIAVREQLKLVLTVPSGDVATVLNYGRDPRVKVIQLEPLSDIESRELLNAAGAKLDYSVESWVIEKAGGNPGVLISAAVVGEQLRIEGVSFLEQVGSALESRARTIGSLRLEHLRLLSVMMAVGYNGDASRELEILCEAFGGIRPNEILSEVRPMVRSGFVRISGSYLEVVPPVLANYLANTALAGRSRELAHLFVTLPPLGRVRLLRRVRQLRGDAVQAFWDELFTRGPLSTPAGALAEVRLLRLVAPAVPTRIANLLRQALGEMGVAALATLEGAARRELMWTLEQLLFRRNTSGIALRCIALLAEAENERWSNNATGVFAECFNPMHPQVPLPLDERLTVLRELLAEGTTRQRRLLSVKATAGAFERVGVVTLRSSEGPEPFDKVPAVTYQELREYLHTIIDLTRSLIRDDDQEIASAAGKTVIECTAEYAVQADPNRGVAILEQIGPEVLAQTVPITVEDYVAALNFAVRGLEPQRANFEAELRRTRGLLRAVDEANFETQVRRWVASWDLGEKVQDEDGTAVYRGEAEIRGLGKRAAAERAAVSNILLQWLTSQDAKRAHEFFFWVGRFDDTDQWRETIEGLGANDNGERAFAGYFGGRASQDGGGVERRLDELTEKSHVRGSAIVGATRFLPGSAAAIRRVISLLAAGRVGASSVERQLVTGGWINPLTSNEAAELLRAIAEPNLEGAALVIDFLAMWIHSRKPIDGDLAELAWRALESTPNTGESWDFDLVAAELARTDTDRGLALLTLYLALSHDKNSWEPLDRHGGNRFWSVLWQADPTRALETLLTAGAQSPLVAWKISWHLPEILDLVRDREILLRVAREGERNAEFVSSCITAASAGFWPIAVQLLALFPNNERIQRNVALGRL